ncbi:NUDIX hydrolase [Campylobacter sp. 19-13652]|uniref:NUDIX domain-containing protein n=1 Tax=Campylobacter sp. 19-13652 TaxID=2840180 RepID=UPI001C78E9E3|nr:NUDIX hydrolase [Campylobacter sp. 19-13652]BCX79597.1 NUDIX domain-containing protein [Campylobacter sp. 19-13652]
MDITITGKEPLINPKFIRPYRLNFIQNGKPRTWECISAMPSVSALLYHKSKDSFVFVRQFRPAVWHATADDSAISKDERGYTYELCAGLLDKGLSEEQTIIEEIAEETGYAVSSLIRITRTRSGFGFSGNAQTMFYAQIDDDMLIGEGGGVEDEYIELFYLPRTMAHEFIFDERYVKGFGLGFALFWWKDKFNLALK